MISDASRASIETKFTRIPRPTIPVVQNVTTIENVAAIEKVTTSDCQVVSNPYDQEHYKMNHPNRGIAVIINMHNFEKTSIKPRFGTEKDAESLKEVLEDQLGFAVTLMNDPRRQEIFDKLQRVSQMNHRDNDCLLVVIMTHGQKDGVVEAFDGAFKVDELWEKFKGDKCKSLIGKPKLFFVQACRGGEAGKGVELFHSLVTDAQSNSITIPEQADNLIMYSTFDGIISLRDEENGTWFIQELCQQLKNNISYDLLTILTVVSRKVALKNGKVDHHGRIVQAKQSPVIVSSLTKKIFFCSQPNAYDSGLRRVSYTSNTITCTKSSISIETILLLNAFMGLAVFVINR